MLAASGQAEVHRVTRGDDGYEIRFALGTAHGLSPGARVAIYDEAGQQVGTGTVDACNRKVSVAQATSANRSRRDTWSPAPDLKELCQAHVETPQPAARILVLLVALVLTTIGGGLVTLWHNEAMDSLLTSLIDKNVAS